MPVFRKLPLVTAFVMSVCATAFAQTEPVSKTEKFYQVVPKHEFTVNGFMGASTLLYKVNTGYHMEDTPTQIGSAAANPAVKSDFVNFGKDPFHPTGFGGGGGFGYIWHFHPNFGLMTGVDLAYYSGGVRGLGHYEDNDYFNPFCSAYLEDKHDEKYIVGYGVRDYSEMQKFLALQIPVMIQFMLPMGQGNHHFYAALGARLGFGLWSRYQGKGGALSSTQGTYMLAYTESWRSIGSNSGEGVFLPEMKEGFIPVDYNESPEKYPWLKGDEGAQAGTAQQVNYEPGGKWAFLPVSVILSAEVGFRWFLGRTANNWGFGLYTALYADYGVTRVNNTKNTALINGYDAYTRDGWVCGPYETYSLLNAQTMPPYTVEEQPTRAFIDPDEKQYKFEAIKPLAKAHTLGVGLKVKFAFGKVAAVAPPAPPVLPKPDTVTKIVYVRDTVTNTKVVRDTVTNTVVVRDTVTIVKEIPQEIKQTMRDLSNTLFEFDKFNLGPKARSYLDEVVDWLKANPNVNVEVGGHTDSVGSQEYNQTLSENRARAVYKYIIEHGVSADRLSYKGYGKLEPIADNSSDAGRQQNRRVELKIVQ